MVEAHLSRLGLGSRFENSEKTQVSRRYTYKSTGRRGDLSRSTANSDDANGEDSRKSANDRLDPCSLVHSSEETTYTASLPCRCTRCGPSRRARSTTSENLFFASCNVQTIGCRPSSSLARSWFWAAVLSTLERDDPAFDKVSTDDLWHEYQPNPSLGDVKMTTILTVATLLPNHSCNFGSKSIFLTSLGTIPEYFFFHR